MHALKAPVEHIHIDDTGRAWIAGTAIKVIEVVQDQLAHGWSPEEIHFQHYGCLSMAQIHAALGYYYDNQSALDAEMGEELAFADRLRAEAGESPLRRKLRKGGQLD